jgi:hypothetical protein
MSFSSHKILWGNTSKIFNQSQNNMNVDYFLNLPSDQGNMMEIDDAPVASPLDRQTDHTCSFNDSTCSLQLSDLEEDLDSSPRAGGSGGSAGIKVEVANPGGMWSSPKKRTSADQQACATVRANRSYFHKVYVAAGRRELQQPQKRPVKRTRTSDDDKIPEPASVASR